MKADQDIILLEPGWQTVEDVGIKPFFKRVENLSAADFTKQKMPLVQYLQTYDTIFTMCIQREPYNFSENLYERHSKALRDYFENVFVEKLNKAQSQHYVAFLQEWVRRWRSCLWAVGGMSRMFMYLDRFYVPNSEDLLLTDNQGYTLFKEHIFNNYKVVARNAILNCIAEEREGHEQDRDLLRDSIKVFTDLGYKLPKVNLGIYEEDFQEHLIRKTRNYYKQKSRKWLDTHTCPEYLVQAEQCVDEEEGRLVSYIDNSSREELMKATRQELLAVHQKELLAKDTGIDRMLERTQGGMQSSENQKANEDLARLYRLYSECERGLQPIADSMKMHMAQLGRNHIEKSQELAKDKNSSKQSKDNHELITNLIKLHQRFFNLVKHSFNDDQLFHKALKEAFEEFINMNYFTSNYLAKYANDILRKGNRAAVLDLDRTMDHVVMLYGYIRDKDIFERDYQTYLGHRLLQDLSESEEAEKAMIGKLKTESGYHWTSKLEDMFKDIQRSKELMQEFNKKTQDKLDIELSVSVCTTGAWPSNQLTQCTMPNELQSTAEEYKKFYSSLHSGRKLDFRMDQGKADVQVHFNKTTKKVLVVTSYQMVVLLLFNQKKVLTFKEMLEMTKIPRKDLSWQVLSLAHPRVKVLRKNPSTKQVEDDHRFGINPKFKNARSRVAIPLMSKPQEEDPGAEQRRQILRLRQHQMDASVVRIMKARKTQLHHDLVLEVTRQLNNRFTPTPNDIKKRITCLIDQEYIVRDENDRTRYHYKL